MDAQAAGEALAGVGQGRRRRRGGAARPRAARGARGDVQADAARREDVRTDPRGVRWRGARPPCAVERVAASHEQISLTPRGGVGAAAGKGMSWKEFARGSSTSSRRISVTDIAATVTYYGVLSLFPFVLFLVALASVVITAADAERIVQELGRVAPGPATQIVGERIRQLGAQQNVDAARLRRARRDLGRVRRGVMALMRALNTAYDVKEGRPFWKVRGIAIS